MLNDGCPWVLRRLALPVLVTVLTITACTTPESRQVVEEVAEVEAPVVATDPVEKGEYLVMVGGCNDCHTPMVLGASGPEFDMTRMLAGHPEDLMIGPELTIPTEAGIWMWAPHNTAWVSQAGVAYAFNLTPDVNTGIGVWTEDQFIQTLRTGRHWGVARPILPPMPWSNYGRMTDDDLRAIWAYLRSIPPVANRVPEAVPLPVATSPG